MPIIEIQDTKSSQATKLGALLTDLQSRLSAYCLTKLQDLGLVTDKFVFRFDFNSTGRDFAKSASRLVSIIKRKLIAENPYMESAVEPFLQLSDPSSSNRGEVLRVRFDRTIVIPSSQQAAVGIDHDLKKLTRYFDKIGYLCHKEKLPLILECGSLRDAGRVDIDPNRRELRYFVDITIRLGLVLSHDTILYYPLDPVAKNRLTSDPVSGPFKYLPPEVVFDKIPEVLKIIKTLSRETTYDYIAYGVQPSERN